MANTERNRRDRRRLKHFWKISHINIGDVHTVLFSFLSIFVDKTLVVHIAPFSNEYAMKAIGVHIAPAKRCC